MTTFQLSFVAVLVAVIAACSSDPPAEPQGANESKIVLDSDDCSDSITAGEANAPPATEPAPAPATVPVAADGLDPESIHPLISGRYRCY